MEKIRELLHQHQENDYLDIKKEYYKKDKKYELIKDVVSFSNNLCNKDKYIIFGIEDKSFEILGIKKEDLPDISEVQQLLDEYVEPTINFSIESEILDAKYIGFLKITNKNRNLPYIIKKSYGQSGKTFLKKGEIYIRKGATNFIANRNDLDLIYSSKQGYIIEIIDAQIKKLESIKFICFETLINNFTENIFIIKKVKAKIIFQKNILNLQTCFITTLPITKKDKYVLNASNMLEIGEYSSTTRIFNFSLDLEIYKLIQENKVKEILLIFTQNNGKEITIKLNKDISGSNL